MSTYTPMSSITHHHQHPTTSLLQLKQIHAQTLRTGRDNSTFLQILLTSPHSLDYTLSVFFNTPKVETKLCNKILRELSRSNEPFPALRVYQKMRREQIWVDTYSFPPLLKSAARVCDVNVGMEIHGFALKLGFVLDPYIQTGLLTMCIACGRISEARLLFDKIPQRDLVTWNVMIDGLCQSGLYEDALLLFEEMKSSGVRPDRVLLSTILSACSRSGDLSSGKAIHEYIRQNNIVMDSHLQSSLIIMYTNSGLLDMAQNIYDKMKVKDLIASTAMVRGYAKEGKIGAARSIFDEMYEKDLVSWSVMISGYAESEWPLEALKLFNDMKLSGLKPDHVTMLSVISACAQLGALDQAKQIGFFTDKSGFSNILSINNALIDMYAKCGSLENARSVFDKIPQRQRNVVTWTSMITGVAMHGDVDTVLKLFCQMKEDEIEPNGVTFVSVLYACSHAGFVDMGRQLFASMTSEYNILPKLEHYGCMVDLLGRANHLREALNLIESMPFTPNVVHWGSLLSACRVHGEVEVGELAAKRLLELDPEHDGAHVLLSNIYAKLRRWDKVGSLRKAMKNQQISKEKGCSRIELNGEVHEFLMMDKAHKEAAGIYEKLDEVVDKLKQVGYVPNVGSVLVDLEEEEKKEVILWHSEKLAICYGLMHLEKGSCIRVVKNLRVCEDCHTFIKLVSRVFEMQIIVRDRTRFHHYKHGVCSCKDYW